jgi:type I restriction enzyme M protein
LALAAARRHRGKVFAELKGGLEPLFALHNLFDPDAPITYQLRDALREPGFIEAGQLRRFDAVVAAAPTGMRYEEPIPDIFGRFAGRALYGDVLHISHLLAQSRGQVVALVAHGFLFRASAGEAQFKQRLIKDGTVEAVMSLPHLAARGRVSESVLVLSRAKHNEDVWFADLGLERGTSDAQPDLRDLLTRRTDCAYARRVSNAEIADADFNLLPSRYLALQDSQGIEGKLARYPTVRLGDIATLIRPSHARVADGTATGFQEVQLSDIPQGGHIKDAKPIAIKPGLERRATTQILEPNDILTSIKGTIGRVGIVPDALLPGTQWLASQAFVVIRLNRNAPFSPRYLYMFLRSDIGQALLRQRAGGGTVPHVQARDLQALPILVPTMERQRKVEADFDSLRDDADLIERVQTKVAGYAAATRFFAE